MEVFIPIVGMLSTFGCLGFIAYLYFKTRHRERMALIESGQDASLFKIEQDGKSSLKWGYLAIAIGIALFLGHFLETYTNMDDGAGYFPLIFIFGGAALLYYHRSIRDQYERM